MLASLLEGCVVRVCNISFNVDNGKGAVYRYSMIEELDYAIQIDVEDTMINVNLFTSKSQNIFIKNRGVGITVNSLDLLLVNTMDTLFVINEKERFYSCESYKEKIIQNDKMYLKINYSIDSLGMINKYTQEYSLVKQKDCRLMLRVH